MDDITPTEKDPLHVISEDGKEEAWYQEGLRFHCTGCGKCCTGFSGAVWVSDEEIQQIAEYLGESIEEVKKHYTRSVGMQERRSLKEVGKEYDCVFLVDKKVCRIYEVRPKQCRTYPWWPSIMESRKAWEEAKEICEGIEHPDAPLIESAAIHETLTHISHKISREFGQDVVSDSFPHSPRALSIDKTRRMGNESDTTDCPNYPRVS